LVVARRRRLAPHYLTAESSNQGIDKQHNSLLCCSLPVITNRVSAQRREDCIREAPLAHFYVKPSQLIELAATPDCKIEPETHMLYPSPSMRLQPYGIASTVIRMSGLCAIEDHTTRCAGSGITVVNGILHSFLSDNIMPLFHFLEFTLCMRLGAWWVHASLLWKEEQSQ
jgi:hypothetical protein